MDSNCSTIYLYILFSTNDKLNLISDCHSGQKIGKQVMDRVKDQLRLLTHHN